MKHTLKKLFLPLVLPLVLSAALALPAQARNRIEKLDTGIANVYLLSGRQPILVDTSGPGHEAEIEAWLQKLGVQPQDLAMIIITHGHFDHAGGAAYFRSKYGTPVLVGRGDLGMIQTGKMPENIEPTSFLAGFLRPFLAGTPFEPFEPTQIIDQEISLNAYDLPARVVPMPGGHTEGSLAVIFEDTHEALIGDLVRGSLVSAGQADEHFFHQNRLEVRWQLWNLLKQRGVTLFHPGHFGSFNSDAAMQRFFPDGKFQWG